jgi:uncharacterized membrane protein YkvA (DUF1232 family)
VTDKLGRIRRLLDVLGNPDTPKLPRLAVLAAIVYLIWPVDLVPDYLVPVFGFIDDLVVLWLSLAWLFRSAPRPDVSSSDIEPPPPEGGQM